MIVSIGEILVDMIGADGDYKMYIGGAPYNVAVNASRSGADVTFFGKVGDDIAGNFIKKKVKEERLDAVIDTDLKRNTTLAFVSNDENGERNFTFFRHDTADYNINAKSVADNMPTNTNIVNLGTLMLSEKSGRKTAKKLIKLIKSKNLFLAMDGNFRDDLFETKEIRNKIMKKFLFKADILKLSIDELFELTGFSDFENAIKNIDFNGILFVTCGRKGSYVSKCGKYVFVPAVPVKNVVDTTGAGDAFFGCALAQIDKFPIRGVLPDTDRLEEILKIANIAGGQATQRKGAL